MAFDGLDVKHFLQKYWQKQPLLIPQGIQASAIADAISPEELAGLACEEGVESRLVFTEGKQWQMKSGPFQESDFTSLPGSHWTLMVQSVEQWLPELKDLFTLVDFLPAWRRDDLMISFATPESGAGPHFDYYDVFIIQGQGSRRWSLGQNCDENTSLQTNQGLKIVENFEEKESFVLQTGDVLYIPPGVAHFGTSVDESLSYSIGFRSPSLSDIIIGVSDNAAAKSSDHERFSDDYDGDSQSSSHEPGRIPTNISDTLHAMLSQAMNKPEAINQWFGSFMTEPRNHEEVQVPESDITPTEMRELLSKDSQALEVNPFSRIAYQVQDKQDGGTGTRLSVFFDGESSLIEATEAAQALVRRLSEEPGARPFDVQPECKPEVVTDKQNQTLLTLLSQLYNRGTLQLSED